MNDVNKTWTHAVDVPPAGEALPGLAPSFLYRSLDATALTRIALDRGEGRLSRDGALSVDTGHHTGRSPKDKFIVRDAQTEDPVWWDHSQAMTPAAFATLKADVIAHLSGKDVFEQDLHAGWEPGERIAVSVFTEYAWHSLFIRNLLIVPTEESPDDLPRLTIIAAPEFAADPARHGCRSETVIACDFTNRVIIIAGTSYAGEMKKAVFTYLNYVLPERGVLPMHCSANHGPKGDAAVFFGLSGTGKTTLSNTPGRTLIGDDEHGWGHHGVFNFEGGCYAKTIGLTFEAEPLIYAAVNRFGAVLENVTLSAVTAAPDFDDVSRTENTRGAYPLSFLSNASEDGRGAHPKNIVMLTADAFGVLPPVARLTPAEAAYHFLSGFTAKVAGTEKGLKGPEPTFSTCFGAPFMPRHPMDYAALLMRLVDEHQSDCWLVNTGWTGGPVGVGRRMPLTWTRAILDSVLDGSLEGAPTRIDPRFGFAVPLAIEGFPAEALDPRATWTDKDAYDAAADKLVGMFTSNFAKFADLVSDEVAAAGPKLLSVR